MRFKKKEKRVLIGYVTALILLMLCFLLLIFTVRKQEKHSSLIENTNKIIDNLQQLHISLKNGETLYRDFIITGNEVYLHYLYQTTVTTDTLIHRLRQELKSNMIQERYMDTLSLKVKSKYSNIYSSISRIKSNADYSRDSLLKQIATGKILMDEIMSLAYKMRINEREKLTARNDKVQRSATALKIINVLTLIIALIFFNYSLFTYIKENKEKYLYRGKLEVGIEQLKMANEELVKLKQVDQFAASGRISRAIAHEIRNPLTNISLAAEQLAMAVPDNEENSLLLDMVKRNASRINQLISELINSTKFVQLDLTENNIEEVLEEALRLAKDRIELKGITVEKNFDTRKCRIKVDSDKLKTAFLNLIVNAIEAMETNTGILQIGVESFEKKCVIKISDNGIGINAESVNHIFDPYFSQKDKGHGLGLTLAQGIILNHDGKIDVQSQPGKGTTFTITLYKI